MAKFSHSFKIELNKAIASGEVSSRKEFVALRKKTVQRRKNGKTKRDKLLDGSFHASKFSSGAR